MEATYLPDYFRYEGSIAGRMAEKKDMVRRMYRNGRPLHQIAEDTDLPVEVVIRQVVEFSAQMDGQTGSLSD